MLSLCSRMNPLGHKHDNFLVAAAGPEEGTEIKGFGQMEPKATLASGETQWELRSLVVERGYR